MACDDRTQHQFKIAMRRLASTVTIITTFDEGSRMAMVATGVSSLSVEPPSLLVCVARDASIHSTLARGEPFCVNLLAGHNQEVAQTCQKRSQGEARFEGGAWLTHINGVPYLADSQAALFCTPDRSIEYGSHTIFLGRISDVSIHGHISPLLYLDGRYWKPAWQNCNEIMAGLQSRCPAS